MKKVTLRIYVQYDKIPGESFRPWETVLEVTKDFEEKEIPIDEVYKAFNKDL